MSNMNIQAIFSGLIEMILDADPSSQTVVMKNTVDQICELINSYQLNRSQIQTNLDAVKDELTQRAPEKAQWLTNFNDYVIHSYLSMEWQTLTNLWHEFAKSGKAKKSQLVYETVNLAVQHPASQDYVKAHHFGLLEAGYINKADLAVMLNEQAFYLNSDSKRGCNQQQYKQFLKTHITELMNAQGVQLSQIEMIKKTTINLLEKNNTCAQVAEWLNDFYNDPNLLTLGLIKAKQNNDELFGLCRHVLQELSSLNHCQVGDLLIGAGNQALRAEDNDLAEACFDQALQRGDNDAWFAKGCLYLRKANRAEGDYQTEQKLLRDALHYFKMTAEKSLNFSQKAQSIYQTIKEQVDNNNMAFHVYCQVDAWLRQTERNMEVVSVTVEDWVQAHQSQQKRLALTNSQYSFYSNPQSQGANALSDSHHKQKSAMPPSNTL